MRSIISRQEKRSERGSGVALMQCKKVNSSEHGRKCGMGSASGFQPARQLLVMPWLRGDPLLPRHPRVPAPSFPSSHHLPGPGPVCPGMPPCRDDGWAHGHGHAPWPQLCRGACACRVIQGRGGTPAALSPSSFLQFQRWLMQHETEQMVAV